jgi:hypothetical protein
MQTRPRREFATEWYRMKILGTAISDTRQFPGELTDRYDLRETYKKAHAKNDPELAPHGFFRKLRSRDNDDAKEFLEAFGPLKLKVGERLYGTGFHLAVDLGEFWSLQRRFCLVASVWESLDDRTRLADKLLTLYKHTKDVSESDKFPLGQIFGPPPAFEPRGRYKFPWELTQQPATAWLESAPLAEMRQWALQLILLELNAHMHDRTIQWERGWEESGRKFRSVVWVDSLWSAIWEFWGKDTAGVSWRRCPHCQIFFYPKRRDQFYCTPRQQALWSKRRYAAEQRAHERQRKKKKGKPALLLNEAKSLGRGEQREQR